jgi:hypothetical protein
MQSLHLQRLFRPRETKTPLFRVTFASPAGHKKWSAILAFSVAARVGRGLPWTRRGREPVSHELGHSSGSTHRPWTLEGHADLPFVLPVSSYGQNGWMPDEYSDAIN